MDRNGRGLAVGVPELFVRTFLSNFFEAQFSKNANNLSGRKNGNGSHDIQGPIVTVCVPMNSESRFGSPSSMSISTTSLRFL